MIPYPGESLGAFDAAAGSDHSLALDVIYRGSFYGTTAGEATLAAGDVWRVWVEPGTADYLEEDGLDLDVSWVVEVLSGTVTFTAGEEFDPDYGDDTLAPSSTLGTHTVTGPATVVIPSGITGSQVFDHPDAFMLHLSASSGSAVVQQVKLRVWPQGGAVGGWSDTLDGFDTDPIDPGILTAPVPAGGDSVAVAGAEAAWDAMIDDLHANATAALASQSRNLSSGSAAGLSAQQGMSNVGDGNYSASTLTQSLLVLFTGRDWAAEYPIDPGMVEGVDWIRPPEEVAGDLTHYADQQGTGSTGWLNASVYLTSSGTLPGGYTVSASAGVWPDESGSAGYQVTAPLVVGSPSSGQNALPTSAQMILVSLSHSALSGDAAAWPGWSPPILSPDSRADSATRYYGTYPDAPIQTYAVMPPYKVWIPSAVETVVHPLRLMQRGDGYGMGSGRVYGAGTRQGSTRVFGSL